MAFPLLCCLCGRGSPAEASAYRCSVASGAHGRQAKAPSPCCPPCGDHTPQGLSQRSRKAGEGPEPCAGHSSAVSSLHVSHGTLGAEQVRPAGQQLKPKLGSRYQGLVEHVQAEAKPPQW